MQYYVITQTGEKFGPADLMTLNQWGQQGRILPHTVLEEAGTGRQFTAAQLPGLALPNENAYQSPYQQSPNNYPRIFDSQGDKYANWAMAMGWCSLFLCPCLAAIGIPLAFMAIKQGSLKGRKAMRINIIAVVLMVVLYGLYQVLLSQFGGID